MFYDRELDLRGRHFKTFFNTMGVIISAGTHLFRSFVILFCILTPAFASESAGTNKYNLIFVSLTNTRFDHLGMYGYSRNTSTNIDAFARKGIVFEEMFSHASWTLPVAISLFTSQYPFTHGMMYREEATPLPASTVTFVDLLKKEGYLTGAF